MKTTVVVVLVGLMAVTGLAQPPYVIWDRIYGGVGDEVGYDIERVTSGGCIVAGYKTCGEPNHEDVYLLRIDDWGTVLWTRTIGGTRGEVGLSIKETLDNGFIVSGSTYDGSYLLKTDSDGNPIWERNHIGDYAYDVIQTNDGGYAFTGGYDPTFGDVLLVKTDSSGYAEWSRDYGFGTGYSLRQTADGGFLIAGKTGMEYEEDVYVVRTHDVGDTLWTRTLGGEFTDIAYDMELTPDGGCIVVGTVGAWEEPYWGFASLLIRLDTFGDTLWMRTYPEYPFGCEEAALCIVSACNGGFVLAGNVTTWVRQWWTSCYVMKIDSLGNQDWRRSVAGGGYLGECGPTSITEIEGGGYVACGSCSVWQDSSGYNVWAVRLNEYTGVREIAPPLPCSFKLNPPYPNPFNSSATISYEVPAGGTVQIRVFDVLGRNVGILHDGWAEQGDHRVVWEAGDLPSGIYFVKMEAGEFSQTRKVVLLK